MAVPTEFRAFVVDKPESGFVRGVRDVPAAFLPDGDVVVRVEWSSVNFKDGLAATADGRVARTYPLIPGIDLAGTVVLSRDPDFAHGDRVIVHGYDLGTNHHGGFAEYASVPGGWVVPLPGGLSAREAMAIGTAGFTAAMSVQALIGRGLEPADGPVLVTGGTGGVGSTAISLLADRGFEVWASTGKPDQHPWLEEHGAVGFLTREECAIPGRPLEGERWAGAVDSVGQATLPYILRTLKRGSAVAACGNASGSNLETTVFPFILRGVSLLGMDSAYLPIEARRQLWGRLATDLRPRSLGERLTEVDLDGLEGALDAVRAGEARGRWLVNLGG
ncbi:MAG TPA: acryloyl-CoA reductase [Candidatus Limnocylindrales bacterium]|nr:acryloyl-CoA reductase [Candidatus Limnocylindrales bacterium]